MSSIRYLMYLRKSSESEERQELSIPAQARELQALATRKGLVVVGPPYEESRSAREPGRPLFGELLSRIERGEADGILCWKLDRLARAILPLLAAELAVLLLVLFFPSLSTAVPALFGYAK